VPHIFKRNRTSVVKINFIKLNVYSRNKDTLWKKCIDPSINRECDKRAHISEEKLSQSPRISLHNITVSFLKSCGRHKLSTLLEEIPETAEPYINSVRRSRSFLPGVKCQELKAASLSLSLVLLLVHGFNPEAPRACKTTTPRTAWQTYVDVHARRSTRGPFVVTYVYKLGHDSPYMYTIERCIYTDWVR